MHGEAKRMRTLNLRKGLALGLIGGAAIICGGWSTKCSVTRTHMGEITIALEDYRRQNGAYPDRLEALTSTLGGRRPLLDAFIVEVDAWGSRYLYRVTDFGGDHRYALVSAGADGIERTADDVTLSTSCGFSCATQ